MATVTQTGIFKQPERLAYLLADSSTWQTLCGVSTLADALAYVHISRTDETDNNDMASRLPKAVAGWQDADNFSRRKISRDGWMGAGTLTLSIELDVPSEYPPGSDDAHNWFMNQIGAIILEMETNSGQGEPFAGETHLNVNSFVRVDGPWEYAEEEVEIQDPEEYDQLHISWIVFSVEYDD